MSLRHNNGKYMPCASGEVARPAKFFPSMSHHLAQALLVAMVAVAWVQHAFAQQAVELTMYYPVAVGGAIGKAVEQLVGEFEKENPDIKVRPVYSGNYGETLVKALAALKNGQPPQLAVLQSTDTLSLSSEGAIVPIDSLITTEGDKFWLDSFFKGFLQNSRAGGKTWGIPFQRSTIVMYWNKDLFRQAGLDPDRAPWNWQELVEFSKKLTKTDAIGNVTQWGLKIPSTGFPYWLFQGLTTPNGVELANESGTETNLDQPKAIEALQYWVDLSAKHRVMPGGLIEWGSTPKDFLEKKTAIIWTTTGNLASIRANASFQFGVAMLPTKLRRGSPTGGGNVYVFKKTSPAQQQAALRFLKWVTSPQRAAQWSIATGYVAVTPDAWDTPEMKKYMRDVPAAVVARNQLAYSVAEFSTQNNQLVTKALNDALQDALTGRKSVEQALQDAQRDATRLLQPYKR